MDLAASAVGRDALVRQPDVRRQRSGLPEHVDRYSAAWEPVAADAEVRWLESRRYAFADDECAFLVEVAVVPEGCEIKLQRLGLNEPSSRYVVDHKMREIRLPRYRA